MQRSSPFSFSGWRVADVSSDIFFLGSTAPFGGSSRQPDQFRSRDGLRAIKESGRSPQTALYTKPAAAPFSSAGVARLCGHKVSFEVSLHRVPSEPLRDGRPNFLIGSRQKSLAQPISIVQHDPARA